LFRDERNALLGYRVHRPLRACWVEDTWSGCPARARRIKLAVAATGHREAASRQGRRRNEDSR
jgi:hypothetical protein